MGLYGLSGLLGLGFWGWGLIIQGLESGVYGFCHDFLLTLLSASVVAASTECESYATPKSWFRCTTVPICSTGAYVLAYLYIYICIPRQRDWKRVRYIYIHIELHYTHIYIYIHGDRYVHMYNLYTLTCHAWLQDRQKTPELLGWSFGTAFLRDQVRAQTLRGL